MHEHRKPLRERSAVDKLDVDSEDRDGVSGGRVEGMGRVWCPGWRGVRLAAAGDVAVAPAVAKRWKAKGADGVRESGVPEIKGASGDVWEEEQSGREEEYIGVTVVWRSCVLWSGQNQVWETGWELTILRTPAFQSKM